MRVLRLLLRSLLTILLSALGAVISLLQRGYKERLGHWSPENSGLPAPRLPEYQM